MSSQRHCDERSIDIYVHIYIHIHVCTYMIHLDASKELQIKASQRSPSNSTFAVLGSWEMLTVAASGYSFFRLVPPLAVSVAGVAGVVVVVVVAFVVVAVVAVVAAAGAAGSVSLDFSFSLCVSISLSLSLSLILSVSLSPCLSVSVSLSHSQPPWGSGLIPNSHVLNRVKPPVQTVRTE